MIDVSQFNGQIRWGSVPHGTKTLVRVSFGAEGVDTKGRANLAGARMVGPAGGYHFLEDADATAEIGNFWAHFKPRPGELRGMIDVEPSAYSHPTSSRVIAAVDEYLKLSGHDPILYLRRDTADALALPPRLARCPLMFADWGPNDGLEHAPGRPPEPWTTMAAHQYTSVGSVPGVPSHVDLSHVADAAALLVPRPRVVIDRWRVAYTAKDGKPAAGLTRTPGLWVCRHPRVKRRGAITITPHRR